MSVRVDQPGNGTPVAKVDVAQIAARLLLAFLPGPDARESAVADQGRGGDGPPRIERVQCAGDEQIGHLETFASFGRYMRQMQARHQLDRRLLFTLLAAAVCGVLFWNTWPLY